MSKLGRYSADRKKIKTISAAKTVKASECGTIFDLSASSTAYSVILPDVATAGKGCWYRFTLTAFESAYGNVNIRVAPAATNYILGSAAATALEGNPVGQVFEGNPTASFVVAKAAIGDTIELVAVPNCQYGGIDAWFINGIMSGSGAITGSG
tara:strand:- start:8 stop:466 length:459 start_codon:yes stop_codon:yes gene_type:complete